MIAIKPKCPSDVKRQEIYNNLEAIDARQLYRNGVSIKVIVARACGSVSAARLRMVQEWLDKRPNNKTTTSSDQKI
jgi:hypothetical protein